MAHDDDERPRLGLISDPSQRGRGPLCDDFRGFAVRRLPGRQLLGVPPPDLIRRQAFPRPAVPFPQVLVKPDLQPYEPSQAVCSRARSHQIGRPDLRRGQRGQMTCGALSLRPADRVQWHVSLTLEPMLSVIGSLSVPPENEPKQVQPAAPDLGTAARGRRALDTTVDYTDRP